MKTLPLSLVVLAIGCSRQQPASANKPAPKPKPTATYTPPISPVYYPPAYTDAGAADTDTPLADGGTKADNKPISPSAIPDTLTVSPEGAFKDGEKVSVFVRAKARECFKAALRIDPKIAGRAGATLTIDDAGKTTSVAVALDGTLPESLGKCIEKKSKGAFFSKPSSAPVIVAVPMTLSLKKPKK